MCVCIIRLDFHWASDTVFLFKIPKERNLNTTKLFSALPETHMSRRGIDEHCRLILNIEVSIIFIY